MNYTDYIQEHLPENLIRYRKAARLTQSQMAQAIGKPLRTYQRYEYGNHMPTLDVGIALAHTLNVTVEQLTGMNDFPPYNEVE